MISQLQQASIALLKQLIQTPSFSKEEEHTATLIAKFLSERGIPYKQKLNNIWAYNKHYDTSKPTLLLNSHHDTVKPNPGYTLDPFKAIQQNDKLFGLGSNDAGGCLVALLACFLYYYEQPDLAYNICFAASAEEEISGRNGLELIIPELGPLDFAIVGEPTEMNLAIAEKGLIVIDCVAHGKAGHAAREEGENAIYKAMEDISWFKSYQFPKVSELFGPIKMSVTIIQAGSQHNVVPATCEFTVDIRVTDAYSNEEVVEIIKSHVKSEIKPRSVRLKPSSIDKAHPIVQSGLNLGKITYGSPTTSDQAVLDIPSLKCGPGYSGRSHMADEYIYISEIEKGIEDYIALLKPLMKKAE
ncbi:MAG: M20/M25/M40 family metallo-hydrolase [Pedobacter sp.]|nr:MAG: M20/M25/M40 family metallo-hydrolase [Pedobacter sp.]